jgi:hypothetical protein
MEYFEMLIRATTLLVTFFFLTQAHATPLFIEDMPDHMETHDMKFQGFGIHFGHTRVMERPDKMVPNIQFTRDYIEKTLIGEKGIEPSKILAIFDVDGTLLKDPHPMTGKKPELREGAMETVLALQNLGVQVIASSAWSNPQDTYERLIKAGFKEALQLHEQPTFEKDPKNRYFISKTGLIASVKNMNMDARYYRQKAYAPHYILGDKANEFSHVLFIDDSPCNFQCFYYDVLSKKGPYKPGTDFTYILLSQLRD